MTGMPPGDAIFEQVPGATRLVVLLHAYMLTAESLHAVGRAVRAAPGFDQADILRPSLPMKMFSRAQLNDLARSVLRMIDKCFEEKKYSEIFLVGHSIGALLARKVFVVAQGETQWAPFEPQLRAQTARPWAPTVKRLVLLAGMNRGWRISHHISLHKAVLMTCGVFLGRLIDIGRKKKLLIFQVRQGAPFLTQLRLQWLAMRKAIRQKSQSAEEAVTIQLLGSIDDVVSPDDNVDLVSGQEFIYRDVGFTGHLSIIQMDDPVYGAERREQFVKALSSPVAELKQHSVQISDYRRKPDESVKHVIFVVHGIRDAGYWTQKIARRVAKIAGEGEKLAMVTSSYGYFPMAPFLVSAKRREKVEWLMDQYAEATAYYPNAEFSCVAHSNGTYLVAKALELYPSCQFRHIVFAGSVLRRGYKWDRFLPLTGEGRVQAVANYVATKDWVVAWFPKLFQFLRIQDLGSAGHDGFDLNPRDRVRDETFIRGGHGAALDERNWDAIARFIVTGRFEPIPSILKGEHRAWWVRLLGWFPPVVWVAIIGALLFIGWAISSHTPNPAIRTVALILYIWAIWKILTRI
jgi:pimeloyl-ACP methyl ester carboxylesterase